jgi:hypothetical protein
VDPTELLATIAELALGLAGFSGVMTAFMQRPGRLTEVETYRIAVLLGASLGALFLALLPLALMQFGLEARALWRDAGLSMLAFAAVGGALYLRSSRRVARHAPEIFNRSVFIGLAAGHVANFVLQVAALTVLEPSPGPYVVGLIWFLLHAAVQFARILLVQPVSR